MSICSDVTDDVYVKGCRVVGITVKLKINIIAWGIDIGFEDNKSYIHIGCFRLYVYPIYD